MPEQIITKTCRVCKQTKSISEFYKVPANRDGYNTQCKSCCFKYHKHYNQTEQGKATYKRYRQSQKGKITREAYNKQYLQSEKGKTNQKRYWQSKKYEIVQKRYQQSEKGKACQKRYRSRHPEWRKAGSAVQDAVKVGRLPSVCSLKCSCGEQAKEYHHPSYAPEHRLDVIAMCFSCHRKLRVTS
ncbi:MAG: hypothetical protein ACUZ9M_00625 [Candidatus Scalindua sp.]